MVEAMEFDSLALVEVPVTIKGRSYVLREATEEAACRYREALTTGAQMEGRRLTKFGSMASAEPLLVSLCLFEADGEGRKAVKLVAISRWPHRVVQSLFDWVVKISDLREEEDTESGLKKQIADLQDRFADLLNEETPAKNAPSDMPATSE